MVSNYLKMILFWKSKELYLLDSRITIYGIVLVTDTIFPYFFCILSASLYL